MAGSNGFDNRGGGRPSTWRKQDVRSRPASGAGSDADFGAGF